MGDKEKNTYTPDIMFPPGETLQESLEALGMSKADLADRMNISTSYVDSIITSTRSITKNVALRLEEALGIPASFWLNLEQQYRRFLV